MLEIDELTVLIEALEEWVKKDESADFMVEMMGAVLVPEEQRAEFRAKREEQKAGKEQAKQNRKDRAILIQAKLIGMRDGLMADGLSPSREKAT